jgi:hypothetical protein
MIRVSGTETLNRQGRPYTAHWKIHGGDITISIAAIGTKTVPVGASANTPQGLVRQVMAQIIDGFEAKQK